MNDISQTQGNNGAEITWAERANPKFVTDHIAAILEKPGPHRLAVPGGKTPLPIFDILSKRALPWENISILLTDDRIVADDHPDSNQGKLAAAFGATSAQILSLKKKKNMRPEPFGLVWLGMGADGHIASLFPVMEAEHIDGPAIIKTIPEPLPPEAPFERLSLNMAALVNSKEIMLVVRGCDKKQVLREAITGKSHLPIAQLFTQARCPITIFWSQS